MNQDSLKRFDRIIAILIHLQSKKIVKAQELSERFQVSLRTIYRDIRTLEASGVPIVSEAGVGYWIMEGYRLPPVMFTKEEASSFVAAEKLMDHFTDQALNANFKSAMYKMKSVLMAGQKDWVDAIEPRVSVYQRRALFSKEVPDVLERIFESIAEQRQLELHYQSLEATAPVRRRIEPVGLFHQYDYWYLMAYCHLRKDYRQFRLDRMSGLQRTDLAFELKHGTVEDYRNKQEELERTKVVIRVEKKWVPHIRAGAVYQGLQAEEEKGKYVEMCFLTPYPTSDFVRWFLRFADVAIIVEPVSLRGVVKDILKAAQKNLEEEEALNGC